MFNGSEHSDTDFFKITERLGATDMNGTTNSDRTNYFENVPTAALDTVLWLESDRMGSLVGAIDQAKLDEQRGVVQNEKRQGENQPYGKVGDLIIKATYPSDHPYGHSVIGSMEDLNGASLDDVKTWFKTWYGPSNAVIVLAGDITPEQAKAKVEKYFGDIAPGAPVSHPKAWVAKRTGVQNEVAYDRVAQPRLYMVWNVPGYGTADSDYLDMLSDVLASDKLSRLYKRLVFDEQVATSVGAGLQSQEIGGQFRITVTAKPGQDLDKIQREVEEELAKLLKDGPTADELEKIRVRNVAAFVRGVERIGGFGGKSDVLAMSQTYLGSPDAWKESLARIKTATPAQVRDAGRQWLSDGVYNLQVLPFPDYAAASGGADRTKMPEPGAIAAPQFPKFERATLSNGMTVMLAEKHDVPVVNLDLMVAAGYDPSVKPGAAALMGDAMDEGTASRDALQISDELTRLGAELTTTGSTESSRASMSTLKATLDPSLALMADVVEHPAFRQADFDRVKKLQVANIQRQKREPVNVAIRVAGTLVFGADHPYGRLSTEASVASVTPEDVRKLHDTWFKPNNATLVVVGDTTMAELKPKLEAAFAGWKSAPTPAITPVPAAAPAPANVIYLVDKPGAQQSVIVASVAAPPKSDPNDIAIQTMNTTLGGQFVSRLNMNLREDKHWSYGAHSVVSGGKGPRRFLAYAPVQTDKTKESFVEMRKELKDVVKDRAITADELAMAQNNLTLALPGEWETGDAIQGSLSDIAFYGLPDDYFATYADKVRGMTVNDVNKAAGLVVRNDALTWIVVGDREKIEPGLKSLGVEIRVIDADGKPVK
jgi:zinc protease